jgi:hypothetical protein
MVEGVIPVLTTPNEDDDDEDVVFPTPALVCVCSDVHIEVLEITANRSAMDKSYPIKDSIKSLLIEICVGFVLKNTAPPTITGVLDCGRGLYQRPFSVKQMRYFPGLSKVCVMCASNVLLENVVYGSTVE